MHPAFHQEIARSRQADFLREAELARLAAQVRHEHTWRQSLSALVARVPRLERARTHRPALGATR